MSTKYKHGEEVPNADLANRLDQLADAVVARAKQEITIDDLLGELTMRIPAELNRDVDVVFREAAKRLRAADMQAFEQQKKDRIEKLNKLANGENQRDVYNADLMAVLAESERAR